MGDSCRRLAGNNVGAFKAGMGAFEALTGRRMKHPPCLLPGLPAGEGHAMPWIMTNGGLVHFWGYLVDQQESNSTAVILDTGTFNAAQATDSLNRVLVKT